ncbi:MAG TPA: carboxymuconolactone decarboxylase family protein [Bryobacteraceae bacterium]|jgi:alkyl hydroperoxide reductase subunit D|nr:carboxymuconolactone decarboxylase family protein [Bryobacteraceae bacterium]
MMLENLIERIPDYAKDLRLNLGAVLRQSELTEQQLWGAAVASAIASRNPEVTAAITAEAQKHLAPQALEAARAAAAVMSMNNVYYRFLHLTANENYRTIPARLRMNAIKSHGVEPADFELWCVVVSAINNCQACAASHEQRVRDKGLSENAVLAAIRIGAVIHATATVLDAHAVRNQAVEPAAV